MFDVLVYVYENYWRPDACPAPRQLRRKLSAVGFEQDEIQEALTWLEGLAEHESAQADGVAADEAVDASGTPEAAAACVVAADAEADAGAGAQDAGLALAATTAPPADSTIAQAATPASMRIYTDEEHHGLGAESIAFIRFLESAGVLPPSLREMVIDRAMAVGGGPLALEDLKIIVLMVFWSRGVEPDSLIMDELFVAPDERTIH